jgi:hypothetical protein
MSVILTYYLKKDAFAPLAIFANADKVNGEKALAGAAAQAGQPLEAVRAHGLTSAADSFAKTILVAVILVACTLIPAFFLPRTRAASSDQAAAVEATEARGAVLPH